MRVSINDRETLVAIRPPLVAAYLRVSGWSRAAYEPGRYSIWVRPSEVGGQELLLPLDHRFGDFAERMAELLDTLQRVEERSQLSILHDLATTNCDVFRFCEDPPTSYLGTMPLEAGARFVMHVKDLLLYAATAEKSPRRPSLAGKRADEVARFMERALLGQTEVGSFVVRAEVPVPASFNETDQMFPEYANPASEPFERKAGMRLMSVLSQTREAALEAVQTSQFGPFSDLLQIGASVGLYNTITEAQEVVPSSPLEVTCTWAPSRPVLGPPPTQRVTFEPEIIPPIREAVRILRPLEPVEGVQLVGAVEELRQEPQESLIGELALRTLVEGRVRKVHFALERPDYGLAIRAFDEKFPLAVVGDLVKEGKYWRLRNPSDVRLLENAEPDED